MTLLQSRWVSIAIALCMIFSTALVGQEPNPSLPPTPAVQVYPNPIPLPRPTIADRYAPVSLKADGLRIGKSSASAYPPTAFPGQRSDQSSDSNLLQITLMVVEIDQTELRKLGISWADSGVIDTQSEHLANASLPFVGKTHAAVPKLIAGLVQAKVATVISSPNIRVHDGTTAFVTSGSTVNPTVPVDLPKGSLIAFELSMRPTLRDGSVVLYTRFEIFHRAADAIDAHSERRTRCIDFGYTYELGQDYAIQTRHPNQVGADSQKCCYIFLKVDGSKDIRNK